MKKITSIIILVAVALTVASWWWLTSRESNGFETLVLTPRELVQEVSVSGQVRSATSVNLAFEKGGRVKKIAGVVGSRVEVGQLVISLDNGDQERAVREAELALATARLELEKLLSPSEERVEEGQLAQAYESGLGEAAEIYGKLYVIIDDLDDILFEKSFVSSNTDTENINYYVNVLDFYNPDLSELPDRLTRTYAELLTIYNPAFATYREATRAGDPQTIKLAILTTAELVEKLLNFVKTALDLVQLFNDRSLADGWQSIQADLVKTHFEQLSAHHLTLNGHWIKLMEIVNTIKTRSSTLEVSELDIRSQELAIEKAENNLLKARSELEDTHRRSSIRGVIRRLEVELGEVVTANEVVAELITDDQFEIESYVPEASIALIKSNDPALVTLDAYGEEVVFPARVVKIDPAETVRDGVSTYKVTLQFNEFDNRIMSGLTANILITTLRKPGVLMIPEGVVQTEEAGKYVVVKSGEELVKKRVDIGERSSFGEVEILSGLSTGDLIVLRGADK